MNWSERELDLFKSKRQRGTKPPPPEEFDLHCLIADVLKRWCLPNWRYTHIPLGEYRTKATAGRLKRMGVTAGWPDFIFAGSTKFSGSRVCWLELKRRGNKATYAQEETSTFLKAAGFTYLLSDDFNMIINWLREQEIVPAQIIASPRETVPWSSAKRNAADK